MNTKQAEELTGISRQNIRYYERQGLLEPARETGNAYRDYSEEDIRRLKLIKMLRMLDMPLKEIENVLKEEIPLKEAVARQQENLLKQQKQLRLKSARVSIRINRIRWTWMLILKKWKPCPETEAYSQRLRTITSGWPWKNSSGDFHLMQMKP